MKNVQEAQSKVNNQCRFDHCKSAMTTCFESQNGYSHYVCSYHALLLQAAEDDIKVVVIEQGGTTV